jgi:hypothetical protein
MMAGELDEFQKEEDDEFEAYVDSIAKEEDEADLEHPIKFGPNAYYELELRNL